MRKNNQIFLVPKNYFNYGFSTSSGSYGLILGEDEKKEEERLERLEEEKHRIRLEKIAEFMKFIYSQKKQARVSNSEKLTIEEKIIDFINQTINMQVNESRYSSIYILSTCKKMVEYILKNERMTKLVEEENKYREIKIDELLLSRVKYFDMFSTSEFLTQFRTILLELLELHINDIKLNSEIAEEFNYINKKKETKADKIIELACKFPDLKYSEIAKRLGSSEAYVKNVMYKKYKSNQSNLIK